VIAETPLAVISTLVDARNAGDVDTALRCYHTAVTIVSPAGIERSGLEAARASLVDFIALADEFTVQRRWILRCGKDIALHYSQWVLAGRGPQGPFELTAISTNVIARRPGAGWLLVLDNPYGVDILDKTKDIQHPWPFAPPK
jgi:ketosteroid isomerase-like protein